jgi:hypothetical protein
MVDTITQLRYMKQSNIANQQTIQANRYRQLIQYYGIDVNYYRRNNDFLKKDSNGDYTSTSSDRIYGENPSTTYYAAQPMVVYMSVNSESVVSNIFSIESGTSAEIYFTKDDFTETFRDVIGESITEHFSIDIDKVLYSSSNEYYVWLKGDATFNDLDAEYNYKLTIPNERESDVINVSIPLKRKPKKIVPLAKQSPEYTDQYIGGELEGNLTVSVDLSGNARVTGTLQGDITYNTTKIAIDSTEEWGIAPQVGDYIELVDLDSDTGNLEQYTISEIIDKDLTRAGINPLIKRYIWRCSIVRRTPSHERVDNDGTLVNHTEKYAPDQTVHNLFIEQESNKIHDYTNSIDDKDGANSDEKFGGYNGMNNY